MAKRHLHTISLTEREEQALEEFRKGGITIAEVFRRGMYSLIEDSPVSRKPRKKARAEPVAKAEPVAPPAADSPLEDVAVIKTKEDIPRSFTAAMGTYGCGCKKVEGKYLCPKHTRS